MAHTDLHSVTEAGAVQNSPSSTQSSTTNTTGGTKQTETKPKQLRYPANMQIEKNTDYLKIEIIKYEAPGYEDIGSILDSITKTTENGGSAATTLVDNLKNVQKKIQAKPKTSETIVGPTIFLPIPQNLSDTNSVGWGPDALDPLSAFGTAFASSIIDNRGGESISKIIETIRNSTNGKGGIDEKVKKAAIAAVSANFVNALSGNVSTTGLISRATGQIFNPNLELLFEGVNLRAFPFTFDLAPRNQKEGEVVKQIIRTFKSNMMAKKSGGSKDSTVFIDAPNVFRVSYMTGNKPHKFLNSFKPMALTDISLNYTGSGTYATYHDGTPVHIQMSLTFKELNPVYAEDYDTTEGKIGVGY